MSAIDVAVAGADGKMGRAVCEAVEAADGLVLSGRADPSLGTDVEEVLACSEVLVEFSTPESALGNAVLALENGVHVVVGATGLDLAALAETAQASSANCFVAPNFAIGAVLMMEFARRAGAVMGPAEIIEYHHEAKLDTPSGTALRTKDLIEEGGGSVAEPIHSVRLPGLVANQEVIFGAEGQTLSIRHDTVDRKAFMPGVILAVRAVPELEERFTVGLENLLEGFGG